MNQNAVCVAMVVIAGFIAIAGIFAEAYIRVHGKGLTDD